MHLKIVSQNNGLISSLVDLEYGQIDVETHRSQRFDFQDVRRFIQKLTPVFFDVMSKQKLIGLKRDPLHLLDVRCILASKILARLLSDKYSIPVGGDSLPRIDIIQGKYQKNGFTHFWLKISQNESVALFVDGSYGQFVPMWEGSIIVDNYDVTLVTKKLIEMYTKNEPYINAKQKERMDKAYDALVKALFK